MGGRTTKPGIMENKEDILIETAKELFFKTGKPGFILLSFYDVLLSREEIEPIEDQLDELIPAAESNVQREAIKQGTMALKELAHEKGTAGYNSILINECKRQAVAIYFTKQKLMDEF